MPEHDNDSSSKIDFLNENFNNHFFNQVIYHCIKNDVFLSKTVQILPLETFKSRGKKFIMKLLYDFYYEFKSSPKDNFYDLFKEHENRMSDELYDECMALIKVLKSVTGSNPEYIMRRLGDALKHFYLEEASVDFASLIKRKEYDDAKAVILAAMRKTDTVEQDDYFDYFTDKSYIEKRLEEKKIKMKTLIKGLDEIIGGFNPPWLITVLGCPKAGKSYLLIEFAVSAIFQGLNVMFISLEMDKNVVESRFDQTIGFMSTKFSGEEQEVMQYNKRKQWVKGKEVVDNIFNIGAVEKNRQRFRRIGGGSLKIVANHRGRLNYLNIESILNEAEERDGFFADVLVVDYLGIMKEVVSGQSKKERISENCLGIKELCGKRNMIGITAMQGNRKAMTAKVFHAHQIADDIDTIHHSDLALAICSTKKEEQENKYRLYGAIFRHGPQHWTVGLIRSLNIGQIAIGEYVINEKDLEEEEGKKESAF